MSRDDGVLGCDLHFTDEMTTGREKHQIRSKPARAFEPHRDFKRLRAPYEAHEPGSRLQIGERNFPGW